MDKWLKEDIETLKKKSLIRTGTDDSELITDQVAMTEGQPYNINGLESLVKKGRDNVRRYTIMQITIVNITQDRLSVYSCFYDFSTGSTTMETTAEYYYRDIVHFSAEFHDSIETFAIKTIYDDHFFMSGDSSTHIDKAISVIRKMLRENYKR